MIRHRGLSLLGFTLRGGQQEVEYHRGLYQDPSYLTPLAVTWRRQRSALLSHLQMTPIWRKRCTLEGRTIVQKTYTGWKNRLKDVQIRRDKHRALPLGRKHRCEGRGWGLLRGKGPGALANTSGARASSVPWLQRWPAVPWAVFTGAQPGH